MKKRLISLVAAAMSLAMSVSAFAATPRESGDVDSSGVLAGGDLAKIYDSAYKNTEIANGNFDGDWTSVNETVTKSDGQALLDYILQPENFLEGAAIRVYSSKYNDAYRVYEGGLVSGWGWDGTYSENTAATNVSPNATLVEVADSIAEQVALKPERVTENLRKIYFTSDKKGDVYLTKADGFAMFKYSLRYIVPVDDETLAIVNKAGEPENNIKNVTDQAKIDRYNAMKDLEAEVLKADTANIDVMAAYNALKKAIPGDVTAEEYNKSVAECQKVIKGKYTIEINGKTVIDNGSDDTAEGYALLRDNMSQYTTKTINDVINAEGLGSTLVLTVTNNKTQNTEMFMAELYVNGGKEVTLN